MSLNYPGCWITYPPNVLVVGDGVFASALAQVFGVGILRTSEMLAGPDPNEGGGYPKVLGSLKRVCLVAGIWHTATDLLRWHDAVWDWVCKLSPDGDQHDLAVAWILPPGCGASLGEGILTGLSLCGADAPAEGHAIIPMDAPLAEMLATVARITPSDLPPLRARLAGDQRYGSLRALWRALEAGDGPGIREAASRVSEVFAGREYLLDLFCRQPSHRNGNLLRKWLSKAVTGEVTPYSDDTPAESPKDWLNDNFSF